MIILNSNEEHPNATFKVVDDRHVKVSIRIDGIICNDDISKLYAIMTGPFIRMDKAEEEE